MSSNKNISFLLCSILTIFFYRTVKFHSNQKRKLIVDEEIIEETPDEKILKLSTKETELPSTSSANTWIKPVSKLAPKKSSLLGIVKVKKKTTDSTSSPQSAPSDSKVTVTIKDSTKGIGLSMLGAYSDSDNSDND